MRIGTWRSAALAGLVVAGTAGGCAASPEKRPQASAPPTAVQQAQRASDQAAQQVQQTDRELAAARKRLEAAHQESIRAEQQRAQARQQLAQAEQSAAQAQQRIAQEQANVQRLDAAAREQRDAAALAAERAQAAAEEAQGLKSATGRIVQAGPSRVVLDVPGGRAMAFDIDHRTQVLVGQERRSIAELQQGAEARVAYDASGPEPAAVTIHVAPARARRAPPPEQQQQPR